MSKTFDRPIIIQKIDEVTEKWRDVYKIHAFVNKAKSDNEYLDAGAIRSQRSLVFEMRYFKDLEDVSFNIQSYRIVFNGVEYNIVDYDDFGLQHKTVKILGVSY